MSAPALRHLPSVDSLLQHPAVAALAVAHPRRWVAETVRACLAVERVRLGDADASATAPTADELAARILRHANATQPGPRRVINATGIILHTNLGRAPLSAAAADAAREAALHYTNLEFDLVRGVRGSRQSHATQLLTLLTGAEAALVTNNNAAAVLLALRALAGGREVIVSRGQLVEIGGSFRLPDIMAVSLARLVEVGTTNRTHARDYRRAIGPDTAALLFVHRSNFRQSGFTADVSLEEMVAIGRECGVPVIADLGSGTLLDPRAHGLPVEPTPMDALRAGVDLAMISGDKLLGGPQAGIVVGRAAAVQRLAADPLMRAVRPDKMTLAALVATLAAYCDPAQALAEIPTLVALAAPLADLRRRAEALAAACRAGLGPHVSLEVRDENSETGGGALPEVALPTSVVALSSSAFSASAAEAALREAALPVIVRVKDGCVLLDPRTLLPGEEGVLVPILSEVLGSLSPLNGATP